MHYTFDLGSSSLLALIILIATLDHTIGTTTPKAQKHLLGYSTCMHNAY